MYSISYPTLSAANAAGKKTDLGDKDPSTTPFVSLREMFHRRYKKMP